MRLLRESNENVNLITRAENNRFYYD
uniref:Uncharacterized protein n=1 Tax=Schistosoma haematobium TaxID=6185 RepID=A0A095ATC4_SCHHA